MNISLILGRINYLRLIPKTRRTFYHLGNDFRREYALRRCIHYKAFSEQIVKGSQSELPFSLNNKRGIFKEIETNRSIWYYMYTRRYITGKDELIKQASAKEREQGRDKDKINAKTDIESKNFQKKERIDCLSNNINANNINNTQERSLKKKSKTNKNHVINLKKEENDELSSTENKRNYDEQKDVYNIGSSENSNNEIKSDSLIFHRTNESLLKSKSMIKNIPCSTDKNQIKKVNYVANVKTETNINESVNGGVHVTNKKFLNIGKKNGNNELLTSQTTSLKILIKTLFEKHLLAMNCLIAGTLYFIADIACQLIEKKKEKKKEKKNYDLFRTLRMAFIGISLEGPIMTWWYGKILAQFVKSKPNTFFYKSCLPTVFDNFIFGPIHLAIFFSYNGILKQQSKEEIKNKIFNTGLQVFVISLMTWTPITMLNFFFVPRVYQATVVFLADFFWVIFLSWCANKKG